MKKRILIVNTRPANNSSSKLRRVNWRNVLVDGHWRYRQISRRNVVHERHVWVRIHVGACSGAHLFLKENVLHVFLYNFDLLYDVVDFHLSFVKNRGKELQVLQINPGFLRIPQRFHQERDALAHNNHPQGKLLGES